METQFEDARQSVAEIVEDYKRQYPSGQSKLNEENTKNWIDALFQSLGWTIRNDVVKEESAGKRKRVDYSFKIDGTTQFLLEAKKAGENLDDHITQAVAYGYQKSKRWVVLTNFEEIRIYNSQYWDQPDEVKRLFVPIKITEFVSRFEDLWILSKPGFKERLIEEVAKKYGKTKPKDPITRLLANDLDRWRGLLTKGINEHKRLNQLSTDSKEAQDWIDEAVQRILDRILFIRVAEDRGIEEPVLEQTLKDWRSDKQTPLIAHLKEKFRTMNGTYNSGLFHEHASEDLSIDDKLLEQVIEETYKNPQGLPYDFAAIDADILGSVYEQYLSVILKKTPARASLKKDEAHRKEQGIYYTPTYIVDYIVKNTLGEMLKNKKPEDADKIKVLDMACGSGSFLLKAFDTLDNYYRQKDKNYSQTKLDFETDAAKITRKTKILKNNIYGVDLDPKAVEIAQLNLLLKAAETKHRLPDLRENIKCGNSLIDDKQVAGERAFNWKEKFPEIINNGGFDVIIGNPPYDVIYSSTKQTEFNYYKKRYGNISAEYNPNLFAIFLDRALDLLKEDGTLGLIIPDTLLTNKYFGRLRQKIIDNYSIKTIVDLSGGVFDEAIVDTIILLLEKRKHKNNQIKVKKEVISNTSVNTISQNTWKNTDNFEFQIRAESNTTELKQKMLDESITLGGISRIYRGIVSWDNKKYVTKSKVDERFKPLLVGKDATRYYLNYSGHHIQFDKTGVKTGNDKTIYEADEKILIALITGGMKYRINAAIDRSKYYVLQNYNNLIVTDTGFGAEYILALINSKLLNWYYAAFFNDKNIKRIQLMQLPIKKIPLPEQKTLGEQAGKLQQLQTKLQSNAYKQTDASAELEKEISDTDRRIDELVYDLYGLTAEERKIVEEAVK